VGRAVPNPLARDEDGHGDVELELDHLKGRRVAVAHEVADQPAVLMYLFGSGAVGDARRLDDGRVGRLPHGHEARHAVDQRDEAVVVNLDLQPLRAGHDVAQGSFGSGANDGGGGGDVGHGGSFGADGGGG